MEFLLFFPQCMDLTALTVLTVFVLVLCNVQTTEMLCSAAEADLLHWLLSFAAREMHTSTLAIYVILGKTALLHCSWLSSPLAWVEKFHLQLG